MMAPLDDDSDAIRERLDRAERKALAEQLEEGYRARKAESVELLREYDAVDSEGWDDY